MLKFHSSRKTETPRTIIEAEEYGAQILVDRGSFMIKICLQFHWWEKSMQLDGRKRCLQWGFCCRERGMSFWLWEKENRADGECETMINSPGPRELPVDFSCFIWSEIQHQSRSHFSTAQHQAIHSRPPVLPGPYFQNNYFELSSLP